MNSLIRKQTGFSLIEVLVGLVFLAFGLLAIAGLQMKSVRGNFSSSNLTQATYAAQDRLELLKNTSYDTLTAQQGSTIDDGTISASNGTLFNRSYAVALVNDPNGNYLRINYTVTWNDGVFHTITFSTLRSQ